MKLGLKRWFSILMIGWSVFCTLTAWAQSPVSVTTEVDKSTITIGEPFEVKFLIKHDSDIKIINSIGTRQLEGFKIKDQEVIAPFTEGMQTVEGRTFKLTVYELGEHVIPATEISFLDDGQIQKSVFSQPVTINVLSVDPNKPVGSDIRGLKGIKFIQSVIAKVFFGILISAAALGLVLILFIRFKKRQLIDEDKLLTPGERALKALTELERSGSAADGLLKVYFAGVSFILRKYLEEQFGFPALESTTREINRMITGKNWDPSILKMLVKVLEECDTVKFTDYRPPQNSLFQIGKKAEEIVNLTQVMTDSTEVATAQKVL